MNDNKLTGKVSWFNEKKGFGVILHQEKEYFAHHSEINVGEDLFRALYENEEVEFLPFEKFLPVLLLLGASIYLGLQPGAISDVAHDAAQQLLGGSP